MNTVGSVRKTRSKSKPVTLTSASQLRLFGTPQILEGEDGDAYDQLLAHFRAAANPADIIDEMFIVDVVALEWEVLRWRRLKSSLIRQRGLAELGEFLQGQLDYNLYSKYFEEELTENLQGNLPEGPDDAQTLAREYVQGEPHAVDKVKEVLAGMLEDVDEIWDRARARKASELVEVYALSEPGAVRLVRRLLSGAGKSMDDFMAKAVAHQIDDIERIDRLATIAESRRNASLRELERRRQPFGEKLRRTVQEIEHDECKAIETAQINGKDAA